MPDEFYLPTKKPYNYHLFTSFLRSIGVVKLLLDSEARVLLFLKYKASFIAFVDAYVELAELCKTRTELVFRANRAVRSARYKWGEVERRFDPLVSPPSELEQIELEHAFAELAALLTSQNDLKTRAPLSPTQRESVPEVRHMADIVLFVALQEEFDVLARILGLNRNASSPAGSGTIANLPIDVLCPKDMGRVPAAVEVTKYLELRRTNPPRLILALGLAGGFPEENSTPGHILCPNVVVDLASRKIIDDDNKGATTKFRRKDYPLNTALAQVLTSDKFDKNRWVQEAIEAAEWPDDRRPSIHFGPITSVDEVISSDAWRRRLLQHTEKLLGVEMEGGGVCAAAQRYSVPVCMLRVVSDEADPAKADDKWRRIGMTTVALLVKRLSYDEVFKAMQA